MQTTSLTGAVSGTVAAICLVAAALMYTVGNKHFPRAIAILVLTGCAGLLATPVGDWMRRALQWSFDFCGQLTGKWVSGTITGAIIATITALALIYVLVMHVKRKSLDRTTLTSAAIVPFTVTAIPGPLGAAAVTAVTAVTSLLASGIGAALGWQ
jgi:hypothetical protein